VTSGRRSRPPLTRTAIVAAAVDLADAGGVDSLSMRGLAKHLGYEVMSLYNHVANKDDVLAAMVDAVAAEVPALRADDDALAAVRAHALATRAALVRHPWACDLWLRHLPGPARTQWMEDLLATLAASELPDDIAHHAFHAVTNHVIGYTLQERAMTLSIPEGLDDRASTFLEGVSPDLHPHVIAHIRQHLDGASASSFELVLDLILDGLVRLASA
jgi:AcrR family transcriptional regulator